MCIIATLQWRSKKKVELKKILWLASWFPNKREPLSGDFIERHAKAASLQNRITVIHVVKDHNNVIQRGGAVEKITYSNFPNLSAYVSYYQATEKVFPAFFSFIRYLRTLKKLIDQHISENGKPDLINVHICYKAGLGALYCKKRFGINYVLSEQWTIFCPEAQPSFADQPFYARWLIRKIYKNAARVTAVSEYLGTQLAERFHIDRPLRIPNVVDSTLFYPSIEKHSTFTFIHVSVLNYQKNPEAIISAISLAQRKATRPFKVIMYGPLIPHLATLIHRHGLDGIVDYRSEVRQDVLAAEMRKCHSLILYSRFETFGCVVIEALASGVPVIASDIPVMHEVIQEGISGVFARSDDAEQLAEKMLWMMENVNQFNSHSLSQRAVDVYSFEKAAPMFTDLFTNFSFPTPGRSLRG